MKKRTALACCLGMSVGFAASAAQPLGCLIEPKEVTEIGSPTVGVLEKVYVERGEFIRKGQVLASMRADVERAALGVAATRAQAEADLQAAAANRDFNRQRLVRAEDLFQKKFISQQALDQARTESDVAEQKLAQAREQQRVWRQEVGLANAQLSQRTIRSPIEGVVLERYRAPGERIEERPILKVATLDPLRVEVFMPALQFSQVRTGMNATVTPDLPNAGERVAKVVLVDRVIDPASNTFRVRLELPNANNELPAGLRCKVAIGDQLIGPMPAAAAKNDANKASAPAPSQPAPVSVAGPTTLARAPVGATAK
jgi:RND family efflux transporter MFP subunit